MRPRRKWTATGLVLAAAVLSAPSARAEIQPRVTREGVVFTSRPAQKPADEAGDPGEGIARPVAPRAIDGLVREVSQRYDMDPTLIATVIGVESGFDQMAVSPKGARGLMQLMPETARQYGVRDVHDPKENVEGGVAYLSDLLRRYKGDLKLALAAYNAGPEAVERAAGVPRYRETRDYLRRIEARYGQKLTFSGLKPGGGLAGGTSIVARRDADGTLVATNKRGTGVTVVPGSRKARKVQP